MWQYLWSPSVISRHTILSRTETSLAFSDGVGQPFPQVPISRPTTPAWCRSVRRGGRTLHGLMRGRKSRGRKFERATGVSVLNDALRPPARCIATACCREPEPRFHSCHGKKVDRQLARDVRPPAGPTRLGAAPRRSARRKTAFSHGKPSLPQGRFAEIPAYSSRSGCPHSNQLSARRFRPVGDSTVAKRGLSLVQKGGHAFLLIIGCEKCMEQAPLEPNAVG